MLPGRQMGRFETRWLTAEKNLSALADLSGKWIDSVHGHRPPRGILLDMDSSVSPTHGEQENSVWNGHYDCTLLSSAVRAHGRDASGLQQIRRRRSARQCHGLGAREPRV